LDQVFIIFGAGYYKDQLLNKILLIIYNTYLTLRCYSNNHYKKNNEF